MPRIGAGKPYALNKEHRMRKEGRTKYTGGQPVIHEGSSKQMVKSNQRQGQSTNGQ